MHRLVGHDRHVEALRPRRFSARRLRRATGCSIRPTPTASSAAMPRTAVGSSQAWLTSTVSSTSSPRPRRIAAHVGDVLRRVALPILSLKTLWRRASISARPRRRRARRRRWPASTAPAAQSRTAPPSSACTGRPRRWPWASSRAVSTRRLGERSCPAPTGRHALHRGVDAGGILPSSSGAM